MTIAHANMLSLSLFGTLSLTIACSKPAPLVHEPAEAEPEPDPESESEPDPDPAAEATDPHVEAQIPDWRCTQTNVDPLRRAIERSCDLRPEFRDDCLEFYSALPVWSFEPSRADDAAYCTLRQPDSTTMVLEHLAQEAGGGACMRYSVTFVPHKLGWELDSAELDKTCE